MPSSMMGWLCLAGLVAIWGIYPLVIGFLARYRRRPARSPAPSEPTVSIILATRAGASQIENRVRNLLATRYPKHQLEIVVGLDVGAQASPEELAELGLPLVVVCASAPGGKAAALNSAVARATGEILLFADTNQQFDERTIPVLVERLQEENVGAVSGSLILGGEQATGSLLTAYWRLERWLREQEAIVHSTIGVSGAVYAMRRSDWEVLPSGLILDDLYIPMSLVLRGFRIDFASDARAVDTRDTTPEHEFRRKVRTLTGNFQLCAKLPGILSPATNPIWAQFTVHKLLRLLTPYLLLGAAIAFSGRLVRYAMAGHLSLLAVAVVLAVLLIPLPRIRALRQNVWWVIVLQAAIVVATVNALRGDWNVWSVAETKQRA